MNRFAMMPKSMNRLFFLVFVLMVILINVGVPVVNAAPKDTALQFNGTNQYVTFGQATTTLGVQTFTLEAWVKRASGGVTMSTGSLGLDGSSGRPKAYPVLTKGMGENDSPYDVNMNFFLGITDTGFIGADFEDTSNGTNHPVWGVTIVPLNEWHHIASSYDGQTWKLYLDGNLDKTLTLASAFTPEYRSRQHAALATGLPTAGTPTSASGYFSGLIDEPRIWSRALGQVEIQANLNTELTSGSGLLGRWGLNDGAGPTAINSIAGSPNGTLMNNPTWYAPDLTPPAAPTGLNTTPYSGGVSLTWTANTEPDLAGYNLYRSTTAGGPYTKVNGALITAISYSDGGLTNGTPYYYVLRAVDTSTNESANSGEVTATPVEAATSLNFDGTNDYVTFGTAPGLGLTNFTLETWFYWTGGGVSMSTSTTQGLASVIPLISKGRGEADGSNVDMNYFLGIDTATHALAVDFEDMASGMNYPFIGTTSVTINTWHHVAATYDSVNAVYNLYLDGQPAGTLDITGSNILPRSDSIQHAGIASAMTSTGAPAGYFQGKLDEVRLWNVVRTQPEIMATINQQITSGTGLVARWGLNEAAGTMVASSVGSFPGTLTNGPTWTAGAPFNITPPTPPATPTLLSATPTAGLQIDLAWQDNSNNETSFKIERSPDGSTGWTHIGTTDTDVNAYSNTGLDPATQYCYRVRASNSLGDSNYSNTSCATTPGEPNNALYFGSSDAYATLGNPASLGLTQFTLETWFNRTGTGVPVTTGTGGIANAIPLITKGTSDVDNHDNRDFNYFLGINADTNVLIADLEEGASGTSPSQNHPISGVTPIALNTWYHVAATYDATGTWKLYLNGNIEATLAVGQPPRSDNTSPVAMASSIKNDGTALTPQGYFNGALDEARIWNYARTQTQIQGTLNSPITSPQTGLVARWGLNELSGTIVASSAGTSVNGTIVGTGFTWGAGSPSIVNHTPALTSASPNDGATGVSTGPTLSVTATDTDLDNLTVKFFGRPTASDFTIVVIPDPQYLAASYPAIYNAQMQWIVDNKATKNIVYAIGLGDNVDTSTDSTQWARATTAFDILSTGNVAYGVGAGNHDGAPSGTTNFNTNFGSRKTAQATFGGRYGTSDYDNYYTLFQEGNQEFIVVFIEYDDGMTSTSNPVLVWANSLLQANNDRRAIVVSHNMLAGGTSSEWSTQGQTIYDALKGNPNLFLMLGGHLDTAGRRADTFNGSVVNTLRSDYQFVESQQSGYLRIMTFKPQTNEIKVQTFSPVLASPKDYLTDTGNDFTLSYAMSGANFQQIGTDQTITSGDGTATVNWLGLNNSTNHEWYATISDGIKTTTVLTRSFTTEAAAVTCYPLTLSHTGQGTDPVAAPTHSTSCPTGQYIAGAAIDLSGATPSSGWQISGWTGTSNNSSTASTNSLTMPASAHAASVDYSQIQYTLSITSAHGTVTKNPNQATYHYGDVVTLTTTADPGWTFINWSGGVISTTNPVSVTIDGNKSVTATYTQNQYTLTITSAHGTVTKNPDQATYIYGQIVQLTAVSEAGWSFTNWNGDVISTTNPVSVTIDGNKSVTANYVLGTNVLTINKTGNGSGLVTSVPAGIDCGSTCSANFDYGTVITLTITPTIGSTFAGWSGGGCSGTDTCAVTMNTAKSVTANLALIEYTLTITSAHGTVTKNPNQTTYTYGQVVQLTATPGLGWSFANWNGDAIGTTNPVSVTMNGNKSVTANYTQNQYTLTVTSAHGTVVKTPNLTTYTFGQVVQLTASPETGWSFGNWSGDAISTTNPISVTMDSNKSLTANYTAITYALTINKTGSGTGTVTSTPSGINCGSTCSTNFGYNSTVTLNATASITSTFAGWSGGGCSGTGSCVVTMSTAQSVTANFTAIPQPSGLTCTLIQPKPATTGTGEKPQSKVWKYADAWWSVFPTNASGASSAGTWLWKLQGTTWVEVLKLSDNTSAKADVRTVGNLAHVLLYNDPATTLASVEYVGGTYQWWSARPTLTSLSLPSSEVATIDLDSTGRLWLATRQDSPSPAKIVAYYSDSPYISFQGPIELASGVVAGDDISVVTAMPGKIGVLWSNQNTKRFGFRVHIDGANPSTWAADESPASQSAIDNVGTGMADDHLNVKVALDGTLYAAVKTGYDTAGYPKMALLIRRPSGTWDNLYGIDEAGTRGNIELDETNQTLTFVYTKSEGYNPIVYKQSNTAVINFGPQKTLRTESFNDVSSTKQNYTNELVVIYGSASQVGGQICTATPTSGADLSITQSDSRTVVRPNDTLTYTIQVSNNGPQAVTGARVMDTLPSSLVTPTWTCTGTNGGTCTASGSGNIDNLVNLPVNATVTYQFTAHVDLGARGGITTTATVSTPTGVVDPLLSNNSATDVDTIVAGSAMCAADPTLVGCYPMEENGGTALIDGSSFMNDASLSGNPSWVTGKVGSYALALNGTSQFASIPHDPSLNLNTLTLAAWIKPGQYATQDLVKKAINGGTNGYEMSLATTKTDASSQRAFFRINQVANGDTYRINATTEYPIDGTWMHVAATYDGTTMRLYINGALEASLTPPAGTVIATNSLPLSIGGQSDNTRWFMGSMDEVRVYNRALGLDEIQTLAGLAPTTTTVQSSASPSPFGSSVTFTATVTSGTPTPSGNVVFTIDSTTQVTQTLNASGIATFVTNTLAVGAHSISVDYRGSATHRPSTGSMTQNIGPKPITVTADAKTKVFGAVDPTLTYTSSDPAVTFTGALTRTLGENIGSYPILQGSLSAGSNYTINYVSANLTITAKPITVTADAKTKVFGTVDPTFTYTSSQSGVTFTGTLTRTLGENVGTYPILQGNLSAGSNYTITYVGANLNITAKPITVTADAKTKVFGAVDPTLTYTSSDPSVIFTGTLSRVSGENVGSYAVNQGTLSAGSNYTITYVGANLNITAKPITVTADAKTKVFGAVDPTLTYTSSDTMVIFTGALSRVSGENVGMYAINQGTLSAGGNYTITFFSADMTITAKPITVTADAKSKVFDAVDPTLTYTSSELGVTFTGMLTRTLGENVGNYPILQGTLSVSSNYTVTYVGANLTITAKPITVTADAKTKVFGTVDPTLTYTSSDPSVTFTGALTRTLGESVGIYPILQGNLLAGSNYTITFVSAELTITAKPIMVTADAKTKVFGAVDPTLTYTSSELGVTFMGTLTRVSGENVGSYPILQGNLSAGSNYTITFVSANLTITAKPITVTADVKMKVFGAVDPALTYTSSDPSVTFTGTLTRTLGENVGTYPILQGLLSAGSNFTITYVGANLSITAKPITVTADAKTKFYGTSDPVFTYTSSQSGVTFTGALTRTLGENVGSYPILQGSLSAGSNYTITYVGANLTITKADTSTAILGHTPSSSVVGQAVMITVTVTSSNGIPTGNVSISDGSGTTCTTSVAIGHCALTFSTVGIHLLTASYVGDGNYNGSTTLIPTPHIVNLADTTVSLTSSPNQSLFSESVTFTATVTRTTSAMANPTKRSATATGTVIFKEGTTTLSTSTLDANGVATFITSTLSVGSHNIIAEYRGDGTLAGSVSPVLTQVVSKLGTTTTLASSPNPSKFQDTVTFTATVTANTSGIKGKRNIAPSGAVIFKEGTTTLGTGNLNASGIATFTLTSLSVGAHTITAVYGGDGNLESSTSLAVVQIVQPGNPVEPQYKLYLPLIMK